MSHTGALSVWFGIDPDGMPITLRDVGSDEIQDAPSSHLKARRATRGFPQSRPACERYGQAGR